VCVEGGDRAAVSARLDNHVPLARRRRVAFAHVRLAPAHPCQFEGSLHLRHIHRGHSRHDQGDSHSRIGDEFADRVALVVAGKDEGFFLACFFNVEKAAEKILAGVAKNRYLIYTSPDIWALYVFKRLAWWPYSVAMRQVNVFFVRALRPSPVPR